MMETNHWNYCIQYQTLFYNFPDISFAFVTLPSSNVTLTPPPLNPAVYSLQASHEFVNVLYQQLMAAHPLEVPADHHGPYQFSVATSLINDQVTRITHTLHKTQERVSCFPLQLEKCLFQTDGRIDRWT